MIYSKIDKKIFAVIGKLLRGCLEKCSHLGQTVICQNQSVPGVRPEISRGVSHSPPEEMQDHDRMSEFASASSHHTLSKLEQTSLKVTNTFEEEMQYTAF